MEIKLKGKFMTIFYLIQQELNFKFLKKTLTITLLMQQFLNLKTEYLLLMLSNIYKPKKNNSLTSAWLFN